MARTVRSPKLDTRSARTKLTPRREPYWCSIAPGRHLGYRRLGPQGGMWIAKLYVAGAGRWTHALGPADDVLDPGGDVLPFAEAQERARAWFVAQERRAAGNDHPEHADPAVPLTVADAARAYLAWFRLHRKSLYDTRRAIEAHILPELGRHAVARLTKERIEHWHRALAEQPARLRVRRGADQRYRPAPDDANAFRARRATANRVLTVLKALLNQTCGVGPWREVKAFPGADVARVRYLQADECRRLLNACPPDFRHLVRAALATGCRYGELVNASVRDFNRDAGALLVAESKTGKPRHVPLDDSAAEFFASLTAGRQPDAHLFQRMDGSRWKKSHQRRPLIEACRAARIEPAIGFHALRHTWASLRIMGGMPLMVAAAVLGHRDTRMVERHYGHLASSYVRDVVRATALDLGALDHCALAPLRSAV